MTQDAAPYLDHFKSLDLSLDRKTAMVEAILRFVQGVVDGLWDGKRDQIHLWTECLSDSARKPFGVESKRSFNQTFGDAAGLPPREGDAP